MMSEKVDYIIAGAGLAGLTLLRKLVSSGLADQKKILVIDRELTHSKEKTWCFWTVDDTFAIEHATTRWHHIGLRDHSTTSRYSLSEHAYYCIKSGDYLQACRALVESHASITWMQAEIQGFESINGSSVVMTDKGSFEASVIFQSSLVPTALSSGPTPIQLKQHFLGWEIRTEADVFDTDEALIMDFRTTQEHGFAFVYVLPFSKRGALVELTYFSESLLPIERYEDVLRTYLAEQIESPYTVVRDEYGIIPMETTQYTTWWCPGVLNLGLAGGQCKASTGYTFSRIIRYSDQIVEALKRGDLSRLSSASPVRFQWYDRAILWLLKHKPYRVPEIFQSLFKRNDPDRMLAFLDERTTFLQELRIFYTTKWRYFIEALLRSSC